MGRPQTTPITHVDGEFVARKVTQLLQLSRSHLRTVIGSLAEYCRLKKHLYRIGTANDAIFQKGNGGG